MWLMPQPKRLNGRRKVDMTYRYRSAETGRFVSKKYADEHPKTTIKEKVDA